MNLLEISYRLKTLSLPLIAAAVLAGCVSVGPDYKSPEVKIDSDWSSSVDPAIAERSKLTRDWWKLFNDPLLNELINEASQKNLDLLTAMARVEEVQARVGMAESDRYPTLDATAGMTRSQNSQNVAGNDVISSTYSAGLSTSWEVDLFGRVRRSVEAANADYQVSQEDRTDVMITLYSNVASTYIRIRTFQARLKAMKANIVSQKEVLKLIQSRRKHGLATDLDIERAKSVLAAAEAEIPGLMIGLTEDQNNMAVLLGQQPGKIQKRLNVIPNVPIPPAKAAVGIPADLMRQRPDIRKAERQLAAETARIGITKAQLYPSFTLTGTFQYQSLDSDNLFETDSQAFTVGPSFSWNIFAGGLIKNRVRAQKAIVKQKALTYEKVILNALREVENALKSYAEDRIRLKAMERSVLSSRKSVQLAKNLYEKGLQGFETVLDAQRDQFNFENQLAVARGNSATTFIRLYTALGGGWEPKEIAKEERVQQ